MPDGTVSTFAFYRRIGQKRPQSRDDLAPVLECMRLQHQKPADLLVGSEAYLDLASIDKGQADFYTNVALQLLDEIIAKKRVVPGEVVTQAYFRKAELPNWRHAVRGEQLADNYDALLEAGAAALSIHYKTSPGKLAEFIPVLLGARAKALGKSGHQSGWFGRLALIREDQSIPVTNDINPNWDAGVSLHNDADTYIEPPIKLQVKLREKNAHGSYGRYSRAGVGMIFADRHAFDKPGELIVKCLRERNIGGKGSAEAVSTAAYLDSLTSSLRSEILSAKLLATHPASR